MAAAPTPLRILILGAGGREHALAVQLVRSARVQHVYVAPGNGGTLEGAHERISSLSDVLAGPKDKFAAITKWAAENQVSWCKGRSRAEERWLMSREPTRRSTFAFPVLSNPSLMVWKRLSARVSSDCMLLCTCSASSRSCPYTQSASPSLAHLP